MGTRVTKGERISQYPTTGVRHALWDEVFRDNDRGGSVGDLERAKIRKRNYVNYVKSSDDTDAFKGRYTTLIGWTEKLRESSKVHGWTVIDEGLFDETWVAPT